MESAHPPLPFDQQGLVLPFGLPHAILLLGVEENFSFYPGMDVSDARKLHELEDENRRLKHRVADQSPDSQALNAALGKRW